MGELSRWPMTTWRALQAQNDDTRQDLSGRVSSALIFGVCRSYTVPVTVAVTLSRRASAEGRVYGIATSSTPTPTTAYTSPAPHHGIPPLPRLYGRPQGLDYRHRYLLRKPGHDPHRVQRYPIPLSHLPKTHSLLTCNFTRQDYHRLAAHPQ